MKLNIPADPSFKSYTCVQKPTSRVDGLWNLPEVLDLWLGACVLIGVFQSEQHSLFDSYVQWPLLLSSANSISLIIQY